MLSIYDLNNEEAIRASVNMRRDSNPGEETISTIREAVSIVGGRLSYLSMVSKAQSMLEMANHLKEVEKEWLLSRIGLIQDCDDDVMDEVSTMLLLQRCSLMLNNGWILAKMEFVLLASPERVR